jgi:DNA-binding transcriptional MerR regulator
MHDQAATTANLLTTAEVARRYDISVRAVRWYEQCGLVRPLQVQGAKLFRQSDCARIELVLKYKRLGFTLAEIYTLVDRDDDGHFSKAQIEAQLMLLESQRAKLETAIQELKAELETAAEG